MEMITIEKNKNNMTDRELLIKMIEDGKTPKQIIKAFKTKSFVPVTDKFEKNFFHWANVALMNTRYVHFFK